MGKQILTISLLIILLYISGGCLSHDVDIRILDFKTSKTTDIATYSYYKETVIRINNGNNFFYTLQRRGNVFRLRTRNYKGEELDLKILPLFFEGYGGGTDYTISPDGKKFIYFSDKTNSLIIYDIYSKKKSILIRKFSPSSVNIKLMTFISESEIIIGLDKNEWQPECRIFKFDIVSKKSSSLSTPNDMCGFDYALSPGFKFLAYLDCKGESDGEIVLLNLSTAKKSVIVKGRFFCINNLCWNNNGQKLGYSDNHKIKIIDLRTKDVITVKTYAEDLICYELKFLGDERLIYLLGNGSLAPIRQPLKILNISTGKDITEIKNFRLNGKLYIVDGGNIMISVVGY